MLFKYYVSFGTKYTLTSIALLAPPTHVTLTLIEVLTVNIPVELLYDFDIETEPLPEWLSLPSDPERDALPLIFPLIMKLSTVKFWYPWYDETLNVLDLDEPVFPR